MDWSFSSPYKGTIGPLREGLENMPAEFSVPELLLATMTAAIPEYSQISATVRRDEASQQDLPVSMLGEDKPIKHYG